MGRKRLMKVQSVYKLTAGSLLVGVMTATSPADGERLSVEQVTDFDPDGGIAVIDSERIGYSSIDEDTDKLVGISRGFNGTTAAAHTDGTLVQEGTEATVEKWARGKIDDEEEVREIPVPAYLYPMLRTGTYSEETAPTIPVYYDDNEDEIIVMDGPIGATPSFDEDLEVLPAVGGGDLSRGVLDPDTGKVKLPEGMGYEDGIKITTGVTPTVTGGIGTLFTRWPTIANNSIVKYKVHVHTTSGFTPGANTLVGTLDLAGTAGFTGSLVIKDFPSGHVLDGTASDPPKAGTTYYAVVIPSDGAGDFPGPYGQGSGAPIQIANVDIGTGVIDLATKVSGLLPNANLSQITDPAKLADAIVSGAKLATDTVDSVVWARIVAGEVIAGTDIIGRTITAGKIASSAITANEIAVNTITTNEIAAATIVGGNIAGSTITGGNISGTTITADKLSVSSLSAISANIGTITAGSITGVTITGGVFRTAGTGARVEMAGGTTPTHIHFHDATSNVGQIHGAGSGGEFVVSAIGGTRDLLLGAAGDIKLSKMPNFTGGSSASAGAVQGYIHIKVNGVERRIPHHAI